MAVGRCISNFATNIHEMNKVNDIIMNFNINNTTTYRLVDKKASQYIERLLFPEQLRTGGSSSCVTSQGS
jgi:hypothetical protein